MQFYDGNISFEAICDHSCEVVYFKFYNSVDLFIHKLKIPLLTVLNLKKGELLNKTHFTFSFSASKHCLN